MTTHENRMLFAKSWIWLRVASVITLLYCAGHTTGMPWTPALGPRETALLAEMNAARFDVVGATRTYWDFYVGFGITISLFLLLLAGMLWQLGGLERRQPGVARPITAALCIAFIANAVIAVEYFFVIPILTALTIAVCLAVAFYLSPREASSGGTKLVPPDPPP